MYWTLFHCVAMGARCSIVCPEGFQCPGAGCLSRGCQHETKRGKRTWVNISVAGSCVGRQASCKGPEEGGGGVCTFNFVPKWRRNILLDSNSKWRKQMNSGRKKKQSGQHLTLLTWRAHYQWMREPGLQFLGNLSIKRKPLQHQRHQADAKRGRTCAPSPPGAVLACRQDGALLPLNYCDVRGG